MSKIYVASSWRNIYQPEVVNRLRLCGHEVYDFKDSEGFHWEEVDEKWQTWTTQEYINGLSHSCSNRGFNRDMKALRECDVCIYVMPCGVSASLEAGWTCGAGKRLLVYIPELREPDLMIKMAELVTDNLDKIITVLDKEV